jgi:ribosomal protein S18 acetylase RimI-like enzyme
MVTTGSPLVDRLTEHLRRRLCQGRGDGVEVGPFVVSLDPHDANPFGNYAVPVVGAEPTPDETAALLALFASRRRQPRVEWLVSSGSRVEEALRRAGFAEERRLQLMARPDAAVPVAVADVPGVSVMAVQPSVGEDVAATCVVAHLAFGEDGMPDQHDLERLARTLGSGGGAVLAREADDEPVGSARFVAPTAGVAEVVGVAVLAEHRGRGIGASMLAALVSLAARRGVELLWLTAEGEGAARLYERAGFRRVGEALHMAVPV